MPPDTRKLQLSADTLSLFAQMLDHNSDKTEAMTDLLTNLMHYWYLEKLSIEDFFRVADCAKSHFLDDLEESQDRKDFNDIEPRHAQMTYVYDVANIDQKYSYFEIARFFIMAKAKNDESKSWLWFSPVEIPELAAYLRK